MSEDYDPLNDRNDAQRWQAIVSQFNAALAIQQDLQRSIYEERFDIIRSENEKILSEIKLHRQELDNQLCQALDDIEATKEENDILNKELAMYRDQVATITTERDQLLRLEAMLEDKARRVAEDADRAESDLHSMEAEKLQLREQIKDLKQFLNMQKKITAEVPEAIGQSFFTTQAPRRKR